MTFADVLGQEAAISTIVRSLEGGRVHHALRFEGPDGVGKEIAAFRLAQALLCTAGERLGCGKCHACERVVTMVDGDVAIPKHPDVLIVERGLYSDLKEAGGEAASEKQFISVAQVRNIVLSKQGFGPIEGRARVFIVRRPEEMSPSAANCMLKTLEEPSKDTYFILITSRPDKLLPTIRSRSVPVRFAPLSDAVLREILKRHEIPDDRMDRPIRVAGGSAKLALDASEESRWAEREAFLDAFKKALGDGARGAVELGESAPTDRNVLRANLEVVAAEFAGQARREAASNPERAHRAARRFARVLEAIDRVETSAAPALILSNLVLSLG